MRPGAQVVPLASAGLGRPALLDLGSASGPQLPKGTHSGLAQVLRASRCSLLHRRKNEIKELTSYRGQRGERPQSIYTRHINQSRVKFKASVGVRDPTAPRAIRAPFACPEEGVRGELGHLAAPRLLETGFVVFLNSSEGDPS